MIPTYKHWYQRVETYVAVVLPILSVIIDALNNEVRYGSADHSTLFPLLVKAATLLGTVYTAGMGLERVMVANNLTPNVTSTDGDKG